MLTAQDSIGLMLKTTGQKPEIAMTNQIPGSRLAVATNRGVDEDYSDLVPTHFFPNY